MDREVEKVISAAKRNDIQYFRELLGYNRNIFSRIHSHYNPDPKIIKLINSRDPEYYDTPLSIAARHRYIELAKLLLDNGAAIENHRLHSNNLLGEAMMTDRNEAMIRLLLDRGAKQSKVHALYMCRGWKYFPILEEYGFVLSKDINIIVSDAVTAGNYYILEYTRNGGSDGGLMFLLKKGFTGDVDKLFYDSLEVLDVDSFGLLISLGFAPPNDILQKATDLTRWHKWVKFWMAEWLNIRKSSMLMGWKQQIIDLIESRQNEFPSLHRLSLNSVRGNGINTENLPDFLQTIP